MADPKIPLADLPYGLPGAFDRVAGVDTATGAAKQFPMPQAGEPKDYQTRAALPSASGLPDGTAAHVNNDPNPDNNGRWAVFGGVWVQSADRVTALSAQIVAGLDSAGDARLRGRIGQNQFTLDSYSTLPVATLAGMTMEAVKLNGNPAIRMTGNPTIGAMCYWEFDLAFATSGVVTFGIEILSSQAGTTSRLQYVWRQGGAGGTNLRVDNIDKPFSGAVSPVYFTDTLTVPAGADYLRVNLIAYGPDRVTEFTKMMLVDGGVSSYVAPSGGDERVVYIAQSGSDSDSGKRTAPMRTLNAAVRALNGSGTVIVEAGDYDFETFALDHTRVRDLVIAGAERNTTGKRPIVRFGFKLAGITHHSGKVYTADSTASGLTTTVPNSLWHDGVPDPRTLVPAGERHSLLRGRQYRMPCTRIRRAASATLAEAIAEIEASPVPMFFMDTTNKRFYFSIEGGADATSANVYTRSTSQSNFGDINAASGEAIAIQGRLHLSGIEFRYAGVNLRSFATWYAYNIASFCAAFDGFYTGGLGEAVFCEAGGSDGGGALGGDGFNSHNFAVITLRDCYTHDNNDNGESCHENCTISAHGCIAEYNGSTGFIPASGGHGIYYFCTSRKNGRNNPAMFAGFSVTGAPVAPHDDGLDTTADCYNCISYGDRVGFDRLSNQQMNTVDCKAIGSTVYGFNASVAMDCSYSGPGEARSPSTVVFTTTPLA